jgi:transcriptional regulator with XRE-family HTH domain
MNKVDKVLKHFGYRFDSDLASRLGLTRSTVALWRKNNHIPRQRVIELNGLGVPMDKIQGKKK